VGGASWRSEIRQPIDVLDLAGINHAVSVRLRCFQQQLGHDPNAASLAPQPQQTKKSGVLALRSAATWAARIADCDQLCVGCNIDITQLERKLRHP